MGDDINSQINEVKAVVAERQDDQKTSYIDGVSDGLNLSMLIANAAGCDLADNRLKDLVNFLFHQRRRPVRMRMEKQKSAKDQLFEDFRELLRRVIAGRLRISKEIYDTSWDAWDEVNKRLLIIIAIANRNVADAVADIHTVRYIVGGGPTHHQTIKLEVEACYENFQNEIAVVQRFNELSSRRSFKPKDIWAWVRSNTQVTFGYDDDELSEIDKRYMNMTVEM